MSYIEKGPICGIVTRLLRRKAFRYRVYPTAAQEARLLAWESALRWLWNVANEQRLIGLARPREERRYPTAFDQQKELTELRANLPWLADVPRNVCSQLLVELDKAWQRCFARLARAPRWKRKDSDAIGLTEPHPRIWRMRGDVLCFPKLGNMPTVVHRPLVGTPKTCTLRRDGDQWFASVLCELEVPEQLRRHAPVVGIDRGITNLVADSDGQLVANPKHLDRALQQLVRAQRRVSRKKKGSKNREKAKLRVMRLHRKVRRQRAHFLHVLSNGYAKSHGTVVIERLNIRGMIRNGRLARQIAGAGWGQFVSQLRYKLAWSGGTLIEVPAQYSSQTCAACGTIDAKSRKGEAFGCTSCGHRDHADLNAAKVLLSRANRSALPVDGDASKGPGRSRKRLRAPWRSAEASCPLGRG